MKQQKKTTNYKTFNIIFGCLMVIMAGALIYCGLNMSSAADREYLALRDHLLSRFIEEKYQQEDQNQVCQMESHGLSKDREVAVRFWCQDYDTETHETTSEKKYHTLYFQRPNLIPGGLTSYAEALGD